MNHRPWRESFDIDGAKHGKTPIPTGTRVGNMLFSSGIMGADPATGELPAQVDAQVAFAFRNMDALLAAAGASLGDVGKMTVFVTDPSTRALVNREWLARFPDQHDRPARHTIVKELAGGMLVQLEIIAVIQSQGTAPGR
ncbi:MAG: RidA family protein [Burkholderiales bacterium]|nr:RidA family protein [Burkholderiales bacterium]